MTAAALGATTSWGTAMGVPGRENDARDTVTSISCASPDHCAAAGFSQKGNSFVVNEKGGVWGTAIDVNVGAWNSLGSISCATVGSCAAGGSYFDGNANNHAFVVDKRHGIWGKPIAVPGTKRLAHGNDSYVNTISCPEPGNCAAGGVYGDSSDHWHAFLVSERNGVWQKAIEVPGTLGGGATLSDISLSSISCTDARSCTAGGSWHEHPYVVEEKNGVWHKAIKFSNIGAVTSVSCGEADSCAATDNDTFPGVDAWVVQETHGVWKGINVSAPNLFPRQMDAISCAGAASCAAVGSYTDASNNLQAFVVRTRNGVWRKAIEVPGLAALNAGGHAEASSISCAKAGFCGAGGYYTDGSGRQQAFVVSETNGVWNTAVEVPGSAALNTAGQAEVDAVSCGGPTSCVAGGLYVGDFHATQSFVTSP